MRPSMPRDLWRIFRWPLVLAVVSIAGLVTALLGEAPADIASWALLGSLLAIITWGWLRRS